MANKLTDKIAIVTGGLKGIGKSISEKLASEGAIVYAFGRTMPDDFSFDLNPDGASRIKFVATDISDSESIQKSVAIVLEENKRIDILVNNAGVTKDNLLIRMSEDDWDTVIDTNLKGAFLCVKAVVRTMMSQRAGRIINIGSIVGSIGNAGQVNYASSKAGMIGMTKSLAKELASRNVLVNCISPGYVRTQMTEKLTDEQKDFYTNNIPLKRVSEPTEIANVVAFFASDESSYITGQVLHVDGGLAI